jgi:hypothetical protein
MRVAIGRSAGVPFSFVLRATGISSRSGPKSYHRAVKDS